MPSNFDSLLASSLSSFSDNNILCILFSCHPQVILIQFGSVVFSSTGLTLDEWMWCFFLGLSSLLWQQIIAYVPTRQLPRICTIGRSSEPEHLPSMTPIDEDHPDRVDHKRAQILWMRGLTRLQQQVTRQPHHHHHNQGRIWVSKMFVT